MNANSKISVKAPKKTIPKLSKETKEELLKKIEELQDEERMLDKEISKLEETGVKITDSGDIIKALHEFNEIRDAAAKLFEFMGSITHQSSADLHKKYNIPEGEG